jgi:hypothetical protein
LRKQLKSKFLFHKLDWIQGEEEEELSVSEDNWDDIQKVFTVFSPQRKLWFKLNW